MKEVSEPYKTILADELALIREKMNSELDPMKKVYYYSAAYAMVQRIFNLEPESNQQLIFIHVVLAMSYNQIKERVNQIVVGDQLVTLPEDFFDKISSYLQQLEGKIRNNEDTYTILEKIAVLTYIADGNGHYLSEKGSLTLLE
jgi:transaldolase